MYMKTNTSFIPEPPWGYYTHGNKVFHKQMRRWMACLYNSVTRERKTISYSRYLYSVHLWKTKQELIPNNMVVDHINNDKLDDRINNFQLLTVSENNAKENRRYGRKSLVAICPVCLNFFIINYKKKNTLVCCCKNHASMLNSWCLTPDQRMEYANAQDIMSIRVYPDGKTTLEQVYNIPVFYDLWNKVFI